MSSLSVTVIRADPAGNVTLLVSGPVPAEARGSAAVALLARCGGEQAGFFAEPRMGGVCRLEMMGGEFCGNALRSAARAWTAAHPDALGRALPYEISGCDRPLSVTADESGSVRASMPLPLSVERWNGLDTAVFPGIVHALCVGREPDEDHARKLTSALAAVWTAPAAGVMYLDREGRTMRPAVWVRDTDTLFFESSCASGSAAAAAILSRAQPDGESVWPLRQPGGVILASARREDGRLTELAISGPVGLEPPFAAEL